MTLLSLLVLLLGWLAPASAAEVILKVKANVATAEVFVDGKSQGPVPVMTYIAPGSHQLRVVADGFDPFVRRFEVTEGKTVDVTATLLPGNGTAEWMGPAGARLWVDGQERGVLPLRLTGLSPGAHPWRVEAPRKEPAEGSLEVAVGKNYLLEVEMASSTGVFVVDSTPAGASVLLDGKRVGTTPWRGEGIDPAPHTVELRLAGYARVLRSVDTSEGERGEVHANLSTTGALVSVLTGGAEALVYVNGVLVGEGRNVLAGPLDKGRATILVKNGEAQATTVVQLPSSGTLELRVLDGALEERPPLTQRWGFWAGVAGGAAVVVGGATAVAISSQPEPLPEGDVLETLP